MSVSKSRLWLIGTAMICMLLVIAGWFLLIAPQRAEAADLRMQTDSARDSNGQLDLRIAQLKSEFAELPQRKAELAAIQAAMPQDAQLAVLTRDLQRLSGEAGVTLMTIQPGVVTPVVTAAPVAADATTTEGADAAAAPAEPAAPTSSLSSVTVAVSVVGQFDKAESFVKGLQQGMSRNYLVDGIAVVQETPAGVSGGKPAVTNGDVTMTVTGRVFVLAPGTTVADPAAAPAVTGTTN